MRSHRKPPRTPAPQRPSTPATWFIRGPVRLWWMQRACFCRAKALNLAQYLWFRYGCGEYPIKVTPKRLRSYGIGTRQALYRALESLEEAGLVEVDRARGRCARVKLVLEQCDTAEDAADNGQEDHRKKEKEDGKDIS